MFPKGMLSYTLTAGAVGIVVAGGGMATPCALYCGLIGVAPLVS